MGPEDPGWEFRLYQRGNKHAICHEKVPVGRVTNVPPAVAARKGQVWRSVTLPDDHTLVTIQTELFFNQEKLEQRRKLFTYHISAGGQP